MKSYKIKITAKEALRLITGRSYNNPQELMPTELAVLHKFFIVRKSRKAGIAKDILLKNVDKEGQKAIKSLLKKELITEKFSPSNRIYYVANEEHKDFLLYLLNHFSNEQSTYRKLKKELKGLDTL